MINLEELAGFLVRAKKATYAGDGAEVAADKVQRPGFKELVYREGDWEYRDSYKGFYLAPGQEIVRFKGEAVWAMAYSGGMSFKDHGNLDFAKKTFAFLKKALSQVNEKMPFRGPGNFKEGEYSYMFWIEGDIKDFHGVERISFGSRQVFKQHYIGGLIISKD
ncbi:hypothetical protein HZA33_01110 [Candidatus Pacearchaeota archaeon]|nr:hypothetical protein [Candidatus Pacearchaeota archaeon]